MTHTPISDAAMTNSEPFGFEVVPIHVARELEIELTELKEAAHAVVERWDTPLWKDVPATAEYINRLRTAIHLPCSLAQSVTTRHRATTSSASLANSPKPSLNRLKAS